MRNLIGKRKGLLLLSVLIPFLTVAQTATVTGKVTDNTGEGLIGVTVQVVGTNTGTMTDIDGAYAIAVPRDGKLAFSYVGYAQQTVDVNGRTQINVTLSEETITLSEVVAVGYGTMKRKDLTGAVSSVSSDAIAKSIPTSLDQALQGRAAGVQVQQNSGMPGSTTSIRIRGISSLNLNTDPIYVIDGVVIQGGSDGSTDTNPLNSINPQDIVSMDILKDASAQAIYGSRAANGVIIISTKRGQSGEATINYNGYMGFQQLPKHLDVLNLREYAANRNVLAENGMINYNNSFVRPDLLGEGTDWQSELFNTAMMHNHNVSVAGGTDKSTYNLSGGFSNQNGIASGSGFQRYSLAGNFDAQAKKWAKVGINFALSNTFQKLTVSDQSLVQVALRTTPDVPVKNADGSYAASDEDFMPTNPMAMAMLIDNNNETYGIRGNTYGEFTLSNYLKWRTELGFDFNTSNYSYFKPTYELSKSQFNTVNFGRESKQFNKYWNYANTFTYDKTFADLHHLIVMAGAEFSKSQWSYLMGSRTDYISNITHDLALGTTTTAANDGYNGVNSLIGSFGRAFYSYADKYLLTATVRRDGSSKFAPGKKWGTFPSMAFAWRAKEESFLNDCETIDNLKLRLGWGLVGNQGVSDYLYLNRYGTSTTPWGSGLWGSAMVDESLTWERTSSYNAGFDLALLNNRIELIFDYYYKKTTDLLMPKYVPDFVSGGLSLAYGNVGSLKNQGIEITLNTVNVKDNYFNWRSNFNFSLNRNKVLDMDGDAQIYGRVDDNAWGMTGQTIINLTETGQPIGQFYGYQVIGRFEKATDFYMIDKNGDVVRTPVMSDLPIDEKSGVWIGDYIYKDQNDDGVIDEKDRTFIGNPEPKFIIGFGNTFSYKNIDLTVQLNGVYGNDVVNYARRYMENPRRNISNLFASALNYATIGLIDPNGPNDYRNVKITGGAAHASRMPLSTATSDYDFAFSDRWIEDGSYLRIQNVSLGYNMPNRIIKPIGISALKLYMNIQNLYTFTKYKGYDPEIGISYGYQSSLLTGVDNGRYPSPRIYTFGVNISF
jgi:TonB-linked SusC/RagA family outer membrane protein